MTRVGNRHHYTREGAPKYGHPTRDSAVDRARDLNDRMRASATPGNRVEVYQCRTCKRWHTGTANFRKSHPTMWEEIGDRAWWNLYAENIGGGDRREAVVISRLRSVDKRLQPV